MKIAIMSDSHDNWPNLEKAVEISNDAGCGQLLFTGDLISPPGLKILEKFNGQVHIVFGNNEGEKEWFTKFVLERPNITLHGNSAELEIDDLRFYLQHYPRQAEIAANSGLFDVCVCGHDHIYKESKVKDCIVLNPGTIHGYKHIQKIEATFIIFNTVTKTVEKVVLD